MTALDVSCPTCACHAGVACRTMTGRASAPHPWRVDQARELATRNNLAFEEPPRMADLHYPRPKRTAERLTRGARP